MNQVLVICGPTATGKTRLGLDLAAEFSGEIISADSRQVYTGKDIITGKDIPFGFTQKVSGIQWHKKYLTYYSDGNISIWLVDVVSPGENFNVSYWHECAGLVISDIHSRGKLPIVVGGTGLYIKSLITPLSQISIPPDPELRKKLEKLSPDQLFDYLNHFNPDRAQSLNNSDRNNPRRLIRAIEISKHPLFPFPKIRRGARGEVIKRKWEVLQIGLTAPRPELYRRIDRRVRQRILAGAAREDPDLAGSPEKWCLSEHGLARRQLTWFNHQKDIFWFDVTQPNFQKQIDSKVGEWYKNNIRKGHYG